MLRRAAASLTRAFAVPAKPIECVVRKRQLTDRSCAQTRTEALLLLAPTRERKYGRSDNATITRGAACLNSTYAIMGTWYMHLCKKKSLKGSFTNSVDPDEMRRLIRVCAICQVKHIFSSDGQFQILYEQDLSHFVNGC